jgi:hypothetical protein
MFIDVSVAAVAPLSSAVDSAVVDDAPNVAVRGRGSGGKLDDPLTAAVVVLVLLDMVPVVNARVVTLTAC